MRSVRWLMLGTVLLFTAALLRHPSGNQAPASRTAASPREPGIREAPPVFVTPDFSVPVLMYHRIDTLTEREAVNPITRDLTVSPESLEREIRMLSERGFAFVTAGEVARAVVGHRPLPVRAVAITMDDGYEDSFTEAMPILRKYGAVATVFVVVGTVGTPGHVTWDELREMNRLGFDCGSHMVNHRDLTKLSPERVRYEMVVSKAALEQRLGVPILTAAYPGGDYSPSVMEQARAAGYLAGWKKNGAPVRPGQDPYELPRIRISGGEAGEARVRGLCEVHERVAGR